MQVIYSKIDAVVELARTQLTPQLFERTEANVTKVGDKGSVVAAGVILLSGIVSNTEINYVVGAIVGVFLLGFIGSKFSDACRVAVHANRSSVSTAAYFDLLSLLLMLAIVGGVFGGIYMMFEVGFQEGLQVVFMALMLLILLVYTLHPAMIAVDIDPNSSAGRDLLSLLATVIKAVLRAVFMLSALCTVGGILLIAYGMVVRMQDEWMGQAEIGVGTMVILIAMALPALVYLAFIFLYFVIDLFENILSIKGVERRLGVLVAGARRHSSAPSSAPPAGSAPPGPAV